MTNPLYAALAKARAEFKPIPQTRVATVRMKSGGQYSYKYADLSDVFDAVNEALSANGLSVNQTPERSGSEWVVKTTITHESGEDLEGYYPILQRADEKMHPAQNWSSGYTFAKRYALCGLLGVAAEESIEGDHSYKRTDADIPNGETSTGNPLRDAWYQGVLDRLPENATARERAEAFAAQIEADFAKPKKIETLERHWEQRQKIIDGLQERHPDLYANLLDVFVVRRREITGDDPMPEDHLGAG